VNEEDDSAERVTEYVPESDELNDAKYVDDTVEDLVMDMVTDCVNDFETRKVDDFDEVPEDVRENELL
jgi:hypothetical protein